MAVEQLDRRPWEALPPELAALLRPGVKPLSEEIIATIREGVPAYRRPLTGGFGRAVRTGVERALTQFVDLVEQAPAGEHLPERPTYVELGRGEAREGRTLDALLSAYRIGARLAWRRIAAAARETDLDGETLALLAEAVFAYVDELSAESAEGWAEERSLAAGETERRRRALVRLLVQSPPAERGAVEAAAREAGWPLPAELAVLAWSGEPSPGATGSARPILPQDAIVAAAGGGVVVALVPDAGAPGRRAQLERALAGRAAALGPVVPWAEAWRSARRARTALDLVEAGLLSRPALVEAGRLSPPALVDAEAHLEALLLHADPGLLRELARRALAPLDHRSPAARRRLTDTLRALLDHQGSAPDAAAALHVHPQTVRYRLAQLREDFGDSLQDPEARFVLSLAVRAPD